MALTLQEVFFHNGRRWERYVQKAFQRYSMGVDLGQSQDYTAVAVIDHRRTPLDEFDVDEVNGKIKQKVRETFFVRHLERLPLGMLYPDMLQHIRNLLLRPPLRDQPVPVCFDCTSNIAAVDEFEKLGFHPVCMTFTGGHEINGVGRKWNVPKSVLVSTLDTKLHTEELKIVQEVQAAEAWQDEMVNFRRSVSQAGHYSFEHRVGKHDDLIFAIAMPLWWSISRQKQNLKSYPCKGLC